MSKHHSFTNTVDQVLTHGVNKGILHLYTDDEYLETTRIRLNTRLVTNFGSCSYLGLEFDSRMRVAAKEAIDRYGTQFAESRAYVSIGMYRQLEDMMNRIFEAHCIVTPTTTLGHIANVPIMVKDEDAVIMDHQLHNCVQTSVQLLKARGVHTELIRHNRLDILEERVMILRNKYRHIWYMVDGIYSMYGDACPVDDIIRLLDRYPQLHFYADDAHGMSIYGENGRGFVLNGRRIHPKMAMATSLNKAFASGGGVLVFPDKEAARKIRTCGGPLLSSGPMQPSCLGAALVAAQLHLSPEIHEMQTALRARTQFTRDMLRKYNLPVFSEPEASIFFVGVSLPRLGYNMIERMLRAGYYLNLAIFPTVPMKNTGIRFTVTRLHSFQQIEEMIAVLAEEFRQALREEATGLEEIYKAFNRPLPEAPVAPQSRQPLPQTVGSKAPRVKGFHYKSITAIDERVWNRLFESRGAFDYGALVTLENAFKNNTRPEDRWDFDYIVINDREGSPVVACCCSTALWKDDMLSPASASRKIETDRETNPYYLTTRVLSAGTLLTEGEHMYINFGHPDWKDAFHTCIEMLYQLQEQNQAENIVLRDFHAIHPELDDLLVENGFFRISMPDKHDVPVRFSDTESYLHFLPKKARNQLRSSVLRYEAEFTRKHYEQVADKKQVAEWYQLYLNVKDRGLELNTFALPEHLFYALAADASWDKLELYLPEWSNGPVAILFSYIGKDHFTPAIIGIDYTYNSAFNIYRQTAYHAIMRGAALGKERIKLGFTADMEKKKLGAETITCYAYVHSRDGFNMQVVENER
ncbi:MAG: aminotransferase class I/II-fold pyridoxal phosphate-dependent enzyme [Flavihumibacter sp.]